MNWEINKINLREKNFKSPSLKIKSVKKMESAEWERERRQDWGNHLQAYSIELEGRITFPTSDPNNENKIRVLGRSYKEIDKNWNAHSNPEVDAFYYFISNLGKETEIPFRNIAWNNPRDIKNRKLFFRLSDSEVDKGISENKGEINNIIETEKQAWAILDYKNSEDLIQENKLWVDQKVYKKYKNAFQSTDLVDNPKEVKNWQDNEVRTGLEVSQAAVAYQNGWFPTEISNKNGSLDSNESYLYNVLTLQKKQTAKGRKSVNRENSRSCCFWK